MQSDALEAARTIIEWQIYLETDDALRERIEIGLDAMIPSAPDSQVLDERRRVGMADLDRYFCNLFCEHGVPKARYRQSIFLFCLWMARKGVKIVVEEILLLDLPDADSYISNEQAVTILKDLTDEFSESLKRPISVAEDILALYLVKRILRMQSRYCERCTQRQTA
jgi:hypothetical protein